MIQLTLDAPSSGFFSHQEPRNVSNLPSSNVIFATFFVPRINTASD